MAESKARINFFSLPAEIRNEIYEMALEVRYSEITAAVFKRNELQHLDLDVWLPRPQLHDSRVMELTSHQARLEARALYYDLNIFKIEIHGIATLALHRKALASYFRKVIATKAKLFKKLVLRLMDTQVQTRLANYVWLRHFPQGNALPYTLYHGPAPLVTKEMLLSMFPFSEMAVSSKFVSVELKDPRGVKWERMITEEEAGAMLGTAQRERSSHGSSIEQGRQ